MGEWFKRMLEATKNSGDYIRDKIYGVPLPEVEIEETYPHDEHDASNRKTQSSDTTNMPLTIFNIVNFLINPAIASTPGTICRIGPFLAAPTFIIIAISIWLSMNLLITTAKSLNMSKYQDIARHIHGNKGFYVVTIIEFLYYVGVLTILFLYLAINSLHIMIYVSVEWASSKHLFSYIHVFLTLFVIWPTALFLNPHRAARLSLLNLSLFLVNFGFIIYVASTLDFSDYNYSFILPAWNWHPPDSGEGVAVILSGFLIHNCCFVMYEALKNNTLFRWNVAFGIALIIYLMVLNGFSYVGFWMFSEYTQGNVLENFCFGDQYGFAIRIFMGITIIIFYGIIIRFNLSILQNCSSSEFTQKHKFFVITGMTVVSSLLATSTKCVSVLHGIHGSILACPVLFVIPSYFYIRTSMNPKLTLIGLSAMMVFAVGIFMSIYCLVMVILNISRTIFVCTEGKESVYCYDVTSFGIKP